jgi:tetratricopeptide (TPR) repeat protein
VVSDPLDAYKSSTSTPGETPGETPANASAPPKVVKEQRGGFGANAESSLAEKKPAMSKKKEGELKNKEAVTKHKAKDFQGAIECYTKAIQLCRGSGGSADDLKVMHNNRAASFVKLGNLPKAMEDCNRAIAADPTYMKARRRRAGIHMDLGQKDEALIDYYTVCLIPMAQGAPADVEVSTKIEGLLKSLSASKAKDAWEQRAKSGKPLRWPSDHVMRFQLAQQQSSTADATAAMKKAAKASGAEIVEVVCGPKSSLAKTTAAITLARSKMVEGEANETVSKKVALLLYMRAKTHVKNCAWTKAVKDLEASVAASTTGATLRMKWGGRGGGGKRRRPRYPSFLGTLPSLLAFLGILPSLVSFLPWYTSFLWYPSLNSFLPSFLGILLSFLPFLPFFPSSFLGG